MCGLVGWARVRVHSLLSLKWDVPLGRYDRRRWDYSDAVVEMHAVRGRVSLCSNRAPPPHAMFVSGFLLVDFTLNTRACREVGASLVLMLCMCMTCACFLL